MDMNDMNISYADTDTNFSALEFLGEEHIVQTFQHLMQASEKQHRALKICVDFAWRQVKITLSWPSTYRG
jgi:hypothetical protein